MTARPTRIMVRRSALELARVSWKWARFGHGFYRPFHLDAHQHPLLAGLTVRVRVNAEEALGELVDVRVGAGFRQRRGPVDEHVRLKVIPVLDRDDDAR